MHVEDISYTVDGTEMIGHLAYDDSTPGSTCFSSQYLRESRSY